MSFDDRPEDLRLRHAWSQVLRRVTAELPAMWVERFLKPLKPGEFRDGHVTLIAPGRFVFEWVQQKYLGQLERMLGDELGEEVVVELTSVARSKATEAAPNVVTAPKVASAPASRWRPSERYSFDNFVVGDSNRLAMAGARAVADEPGARYNPLFIYGPSGLGKTHLLHAIAATLMAREPDTHVAYVTAQQFTEDFVNALQNNKVEQFRRAQRGVQVWLVDDVQLIAGKDKTQEEFFHTYNYLEGLGKQIVLIADKPPRDLQITDDRLRNRFESGLIADIAPLDTETRCAILLKKAEQEAIQLETEIALYLAENVPGVSIRVLEGALTRLAAQASVSQLPMSLGLAEKLIENHYRAETTVKPSFSQIVSAVSKYYRISVEEIKGTCRQAPIVQARHVAIYITREMTNDSWKHIGVLFGNKDHTSMMHGHEKISNLVLQDRDLRAEVRSIMKGLKPE